MNTSSPFRSRFRIELLEERFAPSCLLWASADVLSPMDGQNTLLTATSLGGVNPFDRIVAVGTLVGPAYLEIPSTPSTLESSGVAANLSKQSNFDALINDRRDMPPWAEEFLDKLHRKYDGQKETRTNGSTHVVTTNPTIDEESGAIDRPALSSTNGNTFVDDGGPSLIPSWALGLLGEIQERFDERAVPASNTKAEHHPANETREITST
jgi:hypothetical protein